ncbi:unnamed protein product [Prunus brigantina]
MFETRLRFEKAKSFTIPTHSKEAQASKGQGKDIAVSKTQMGEAKSVPSNPAKKMRFTSSSKKDPSSATFDEETKLTRSINTTSRIVKGKSKRLSMWLSTIKWQTTWQGCY